MPKLSNIANLLYMLLLGFYLLPILPPIVNYVNMTTAGNCWIFYQPKLVGTRTNSTFTYNFLCIHGCHVKLHQHNL